jgi:S-adenosylmethionine synthetase
MDGVIGTVPRFNAADGDTPDSIHLTVTGKSAEAGNDGEAGRSNRILGADRRDRAATLGISRRRGPRTEHAGDRDRRLAAAAKTRSRAEADR